MRRYKYYSIKAGANKQSKPEVLYSSYSRQDCKDELESERDNWKEEGYKLFVIGYDIIDEAPDMSIYTFSEIEAVS